MTSGGTESILSAVKASRDYMKATRGIWEPEMIIANSAHAAFYKAAEFFRIKLIQVTMCTSENMRKKECPRSGPEFVPCAWVLPSCKDGAVMCGSGVARVTLG